MYLRFFCLDCCAASLLRMALLDDDDEDDELFVVDDELFAVGVGTGDGKIALVMDAGRERSSM